MRKLWDHQLKAIQRTKAMEHFALFFETGTGKTRTCIEIIRGKNLQNGGMLKVLILTPQVVTFNWKKEFAMFAPEILPSQVMVLHGSGKDRLKMLEQTPSYFVVICNYETLQMEQVFEFLKGWKPEVVVADESHRIKNPRAMRTKRAIVLSDTARFRYILTGTPILQDQADLFSQYLFLDKGKLFGKNQFVFRHKYFTDANEKLRAKAPHVTWPKWVPKKSSAEELREKVMSIAMEVKKSECLDLPPYIRQVIEVGMTKKQAKAYKEMKDDYITFIGSKAFTAQLAITKSLRLQQIVSGFLMGEAEGEAYKSVFEPDPGEKWTPREKALLELLEDITPNHKVIVWACWRANHDSIRRLLLQSGIGHVELLGDMSATGRDKSIQAFREDPETRVLLGSQAAGGIGINLVEASYTIYFSRGFSLEHDVQSEARNYRGGSEVHEKITRIDLCTAGTIDETVTKALAAKQEVSDQIIKGEALV